MNWKTIVSSSVFVTLCGSKTAGRMNEKIVLTVAMMTIRMMKK